MTIDLYNLPDPIRWNDGKVVIIDQTLLPHSEKFLSTKNYRDVCEWIKSLRIRGAPAIGIAAAYAGTLAAIEFGSRNEIDPKLEQALTEIQETRPTAVNLKNILARLRKTPALRLGMNWEHRRDIFKRVK